MLKRLFHSFIRRPRVTHLPVQLRAPRYVGGYGCWPEFDRQES